MRTDGMPTSGWLNSMHRPMGSSTAAAALPPSSIAQAAQLPAWALPVGVPLAVALGAAVIAWLHARSLTKVPTLQFQRTAFNEQV
jgi:hypothetical protein